MPQGRKTSTSGSGRITGSYIGHPRGFGFLVPEGGGADLFVPPGREGDAIDGDTVVAERMERDAARVIGVLERGRPLLVGTHLGRDSFLADAHRVPKILRVEGKARKGDKVLVAATLKGRRIRRVIGRAGAPDVEDAAVVAELEISPKFAPSALKEADRLQPPTRRDAGRRMDLRDKVTIVTIDPVTSRDFDDAISLERTNSGWLLGVHIADVSHYVREGSALDKEAHQRGTSVYLPNRVIPMLPEKLSNDLCSLREGTDRLAMSVLMQYSKKGKLMETTFAESIIRSDRRFSYERASRVMEGAKGERGKVQELLRNMAQLATLLKKGRRSLDIPRQEIELVYNGAGDVVDLHSPELDIAHGVIEEFMLAANREVARLMLRRGVPVMFRHHPEPTDMSAVWETARLLRVNLGKKPTLANAIAKCTEAGFQPAIAAELFRCMPRAVYTTSASSHFSLGFEAYCHFTSPIRRYVDLVTHRTLRKTLRETHGPVRQRPGGELGQPTSDRKQESLAEHLNARTLAADRAESRVRRRRILEFLLRQGGIPTEGQVTLVLERGLTLDLPEYSTSGFLSVDLLPGGPFKLGPGELKGSRQAYRLGDTLDVQIHRIDPASSQLDLALAPKF